MPNNPSREAFEKKFAPLGYTFGIDETDGEYLFADTHHAWLGWQAGAQAERERAAKICEELPAPGSCSNVEDVLWGVAQRMSARKIRDRSAP